MPDLSGLQKELEKFGLSSSQAKIYLLLVEHKQLRIQAIAKLADMPRSSVYENLKRLFELGIAEETTVDSYKIIRPYPLGIKHHGLDETILKVQRLKKDLGSLEKKINLAPLDMAEGQSAVRFYRGRSGARQLLWNTLKAKNKVYVYSNWGRGRYVGMKFYQNFVNESRRREIKEQVLINPTDPTLESIRKFTYPGSPISRTRLEDIRAIDKIKITGDTFIYNNIYSTIYLKNIEINGFEIESQQFIETQSAIFETLWDLALPIKELL